MKKSYLFTALLAGLIAAGCSQNETIGDMVDGAQTPVAFGTYVGKATNGRVASKVDWTNGDKMGVFGYYTKTDNYGTGSYVSPNPDFMLNQEVSYNSAAWTYSPLKYWPNGMNNENTVGKVSFFAYFPKGNAAITSNVTAASTGDPTITYIPNATNITNRVDLLYASLPNQTKESATGNANFTFKHALSRIGFTVQLAADYSNSSTTTVTLDKIEFGGTDKTMGAGVLYGTGTLNLNTGAWTATTGGSNYSLELNGTTVTDFTSNIITTTGISNEAGSNFMIIPQDLSAANAGKMRITYTVKTKDAAYDTNPGDGDGYVTVQNTEVTDIAQNFVAETAYRYTITITLTGVTVTVDSITPWTSEISAPEPKP